MKFSLGLLLASDRNTRAREISAPPALERALRQATCEHRYNRNGGQFVCALCGHAREAGGGEGS